MTLTQVIVSLLVTLGIQNASFNLIGYFDPSAQRVRRPYLVINTLKDRLQNVMQTIGLYKDYKGTGDIINLSKELLGTSPYSFEGYIAAIIIDIDRLCDGKIAVLNSERMGMLEKITFDSSPNQLFDRWSTRPVLIDYIGGYDLNYYAARPADTLNLNSMNFGVQSLVSGHYALYNTMSLENLRLQKLSDRCILYDKNLNIKIEADNKAIAEFQKSYESCSKSSDAQGISGKFREEEVNRLMSESDTVIESFKLKSKQFSLNLLDYRQKARNENIQSLVKDLSKEFNKINQNYNLIMSILRKNGTAQFLDEVYRANYVHIINVNSIENIFRVFDANKYFIGYFENYRKFEESNCGLKYSELMLMHYTMRGVDMNVTDKLMLDKNIPSLSIWQIFSKKSPDKIVLPPEYNFDTQYFKKYDIESELVMIAKKVPINAERKKEDIKNGDQPPDVLPDLFDIIKCEEVEQKYKSLNDLLSKLSKNNTFMTMMNDLFQKYIDAIQLTYKNAKNGMINSNNKMSDGYPIDCHFYARYKYVTHVDNDAMNQFVLYKIYGRSETRQSESGRILI